MGKIMGKYVKVILLVLLVVTLGVSEVSAFAYNSEEDFDKAIKEKEAEIEKVKKDLLGHKTKKEDTIVEKEDIEEDIKKKEKAIKKTKKEIKGKEEEIEGVNEEILELHKEIKEIEIKKAEREEEFRERVSSIHESGTSSFIDVVLSAKSFSSMVSSLFSYQTVVEKDNEIIEEYLEISRVLDSKRLEVELKLKELEERLEELTELGIAIEIEKEDLKVLKKQKEEDIVKVSDLIVGSAERYNKLKLDKEGIEEDKEKWLKEEEEKKKRLAAEAKAKKDLEKLLKSSGGGVSVNSKIIKSIGEEDFIVPTSGRISSPFGGRWGKLHAGIDIATPVGTAVYASAEGEVTKANSGDNGGYGKLVTVKHTVNGKSYETRYAHLSAVGVSVGDKVSQGQVLALSGNTGRSTGPHLHFEVRTGGKAYDPMGFLNFK